jgi:uncharacterized SAM-binding protein YcdF (DUF218 family)
MFFFLSKILLFLISPFFWLLIGLLVFFKTKNQSLRKRMKYILPFYFLFFTNTSVFLEFCRIWEVPGTRISDLKEHKVGVVLGGMFEYDTNLDRLSIRRGGDRLVQAISLYKSGKIDYILLSGDNGHLNDRGLHEAKQSKNLLKLWGIPDSVLLTETRSKNTHENAVNTVAILKEKRLSDSVLLITSGLHMRRALDCFKQNGINATPFSTDLYTGKKRGYQLDQVLVPNPYNFVLWNFLLKEIVGYVTYDIRGYL